MVLASSTYLGGFQDSLMFTPWLLICQQFRTIAMVLGDRPVEDALETGIYCKLPVSSTLLI